MTHPAAARILIVTNGQLGRNPRPWKEADALAQAGYAVTVLMVRNHAATEAEEQRALEGAGFRREAVDLIPGFAAGPWRLLARRGAAAAARRLAKFTRRPTIHTLGPARLLLRRARQLPADLTIVHNEVPHWVGVQLMADGRRVAADIEDWHSEDLMPDQRRNRPLALLRSVEGELLARAAYTTTTSQALADALHARYGGTRPSVIANAFPLQADPHRGPPGNPPAWFWFSQTLGPGRGLESFLDAWALTRQPSRVVLLGAPVPGFAEALRARLPAARRAALSFLPPVAPAALPTLIAQHDLGLALEDAAIVNRDLTITNKVLQYLNAGLAVLATPTAGQREVLAHAPGAGLIAEMAVPGAAAAVLDGMLADRALLARRQAAARRAAEAVYSWEREAPRLVALAARALAEGPPAGP
jgi:glycosyltransferase involved in cell wall biosynthesis